MDNKVAHKFVRVSDESNSMVELVEFVRSLENGSKQFRYFKNRTIQIVKSHEVTLLLKCNRDIVAYGHLEKEDDRLWLGIAVADAHVGQGWGKKMTQKLITEANALSMDKLSLRVDTNNAGGIRLYKNMGFEIVNEKEKGASLLMERTLDSDNS